MNNLESVLTYEGTHEVHTPRRRPGADGGERIQIDQKIALLVTEGRNLVSGK